MPAHHKIAKFFAHPLVLLVVGTALTSWVVPYVSSKANRTKIVRDESQRVANEIIQNSTEINRDLNGMEVTLEFFYKNNSQPPLQIPAYYRKQQAQTLSEMEAEYRAYDRLAWWWPRDVYWEASFLSFMPHEELEQIQQYGNAYVKNLSASNAVLNALWTDLLRRPFNPNDRRLANEIADTRNQLAQLQFARNHVSSQFVRIFMPW